MLCKYACVMLFVSKTSYFIAVFTCACFAVGIPGCSIWADSYISGAVRHVGERSFQKINVEVVVICCSSPTEHNLYPVLPSATVTAYLRTGINVFRTWIGSC